MVEHGGLTIRHAVSALRPPFLRERPAGDGIERGGVGVGAGRGGGKVLPGADVISMIDADFPGLPMTRGLT